MWLMSLVSPETMLPGFFKMINILRVLAATPLDKSTFTLKSWWGNTPTTLNFNFKKKKFLKNGGGEDNFSIGDWSWKGDGTLHQIRLKLSCDLYKVSLKRWTKLVVRLARPYRILTNINIYKHRDTILEYYTVRELNPFL